MGVPGLWNLLIPAAQRRSLMELTTYEGFEAKRHGTGMIVIGIDTSIWLNQVQAVFHHPRHSQTGASPELRTLFSRLCRLLCLPVIPVFVFDGPNRPSMKRGKRVGKKPHWLLEDFQKFITAFGFHSHQAPGEAEAELAYLNCTGAIDAVMTDDVDVFIFGATHVLRSQNAKRDGDDVTIFTASAIEAHKDIHLRQQDFFLIAVMSGGDYDNGLLHCGVSIPHKLSHTDLGRSLFDAARSLSRSKLAEFICSWREDLRHTLKNDPTGHLGRRFGDLASSIDESFPSLDTIINYACPVTSWSGGAQGPDTSRWVASQPNIPKIILLCQRSFSWGSPDQVLARLKEHVWPGCYVRRLMEPISLLTALQQHIEDGVVIDTAPSLLTFFEIDKVKIGGGLAQSSKLCRVHVSTRDLTILVQQSYSANPLEDSTPDFMTSDPVPKMVLWLPISFMQHTLPSLIKRFGKHNFPAAPRRSPIFLQAVQAPPTIISKPRLEVMKKPRNKKPLPTPSTSLVGSASPKKTSKPQKRRHEVIDMTGDDETPPPVSSLHLSSSATTSHSSRDPAPPTKKLKPPKQQHEVIDMTGDDDTPYASSFVIPSLGTFDLTRDVSPTLLAHPPSRASSSAIISLGTFDLTHDISLNALCRPHLAPVAGPSFVDMLQEADDDDESMAGPSTTVIADDGPMW